MNLHEIINRDPKTPTTEAEALFVIKEFLRIKVGVVVNPVIEKNYGDFRILREYSLMTVALQKAINYFIKNPDKITL